MVSEHYVSAWNSIYWLCKSPRSLPGFNTLERTKGSRLFTNPKISLNDYETPVNQGHILYRLRTQHLYRILADGGRVL